MKINNDSYARGMKWFKPHCTLSIIIKNNELVIYFN